MQRGHRVIVANARKLRAISTSHTKNDAEDARLLARLGRADPALLSPIQHRSEPGQRALVRLKVREALVRNRVNLINSARFLLKSLGVFVSASIKALAFTRKVRAQLAAAATCGPVRFGGVGAFRGCGLVRGRLRATAPTLVARVFGTVAR